MTSTRLTMTTLKYQYNLLELISPMANMLLKPVLDTSSSYHRSMEQTFFMISSSIWKKIMIYHMDLPDIAFMTRMGNGSDTNGKVLPTFTEFGQTQVYLSKSSFLLSLGLPGYTSPIILILLNPNIEMSMLGNIMLSWKS